MLINSRYVSFVSHFVGLLSFLAIPVVFLSQGLNNDKDIFEILLTKECMVFYGYYIFLFYFNSYWIIPNYFLKRKYGIYTAILLILFIAAFFLKPFDNLVSYETYKNNHAPSQKEAFRKAPPNPPLRSSEFDHGKPPGDVRNPPPSGRRRVAFDIISIFLFILTVAINLAFETSKQWRNSQKVALIAENEKMNAELSFLKAQINPHFLFNTLNNIYALVVSQSEKAGPALLKLSSIMRYVTDEISRDSVALSKEVECIKDYIELQKLRIGKKVHLTCEITEDVDNKTITPLILLTFIENVFKYGLSNHLDAPITIRLTTSADRINFFCQNRIFQNRQKEERSGVGIVNTKRRLDFLYPNRHILEIKENEETFTVNLTLMV